MDLQGFTTIDEVGDDDETSDKEVRANKVNIFSPHKAAEEMAYLNKIILDMEKDENDSKNNTDSSLNSETKLGIQTENNICISQSCNTNPINKLTLDQFSNSKSCDSNVSNSQFESGSKDNHSHHSIGNKDFVSDNSESFINNNGEHNLNVVDMSQNSLLIDTSDDKPCNNDLNSNKISDLSVISSTNVNNKNNNNNNNSETSVASLSEEHSSQNPDSKGLSENESNTDQVEEKNSDTSCAISDANKSGNDSSKQSDDDYINISLPLRISCIKTEPVDAEPNEVDFGDYFNDPAEEFDMSSYSNVKEESEMGGEMANFSDQNMDAVAITKFETTDEDESSFTSFIPKVHFRVRRKVIYSKEQVTAAAIMAQFSVATVINMNMFEQLGNSMPTIKLHVLENISPDYICFEDLEPIDIFFAKFGRNPKKWKKYFKVRKSKKSVDKKETPKSSTKQHKKSKKFSDSDDIKVLQEKYREAINRTIAQNVVGENKDKKFSETSSSPKIKSDNSIFKDKINKSITHKTESKHSKLHTKIKKEKVDLSHSTKKHSKSKDTEKMANEAKDNSFNKDNDSSKKKIKESLPSENKKNLGCPLSKKSKNRKFNKSLLKLYKIKPCSVVLSRDIYPPPRPPSLNGTIKTEDDVKKGSDEPKSSKHNDHYKDHHHQLHKDHHKDHHHHRKHKEKKHKKEKELHKKNHKDKIKSDKLSINKFKLPKPKSRKDIDENQAISKEMTKSTDLDDKPECSDFEIKLNVCDIPLASDGDEHEVTTLLEYSKTSYEIKKITSVQSTEKLVQRETNKLNECDIASDRDEHEVTTVLESNKTSSESKEISSVHSTVKLVQREINKLNVFDITLASDKNEHDVTTKLESIKTSSEFDILKITSVQNTEKSVQIEKSNEIQKIYSSDDSQSLDMGANLNDSDSSLSSCKEKLKIGPKSKIRKKQILNISSDSSNNIESTDFVNSDCESDKNVETDFRKFNKSLASTPESNKSEKVKQCESPNKSESTNRSFDIDSIFSPSKLKDFSFNEEEEEFHTKILSTVVDSDKVKKNLSYDLKNKKDSKENENSSDNIMFDGKVHDSSKTIDGQNAFDSKSDTLIAKDKENDEVYDSQTIKNSKLEEPNKQSSVDSENKNLNLSLLEEKQVKEANLDTPCIENKTKDDIQNSQSSKNDTYRENKSSIIESKSESTSLKQLSSEEELSYSSKSLKQLSPEDKLSSSSKMSTSNIEKIVNQEIQNSVSIKIENPEENQKKFSSLGNKSDRKRCRTESGDSVNDLESQKLIKKTKKESLKLKDSTHSSKMRKTMRIKKCYVHVEDIYYNTLYRKKIKREKRYWAMLKLKRVNLDSNENAKLKVGVKLENQWKSNNEKDMDTHKSSKNKNMSSELKLENRKEGPNWKMEHQIIKEVESEKVKETEQMKIIPVKKKTLTEVPLFGLAFKIPKKTAAKDKKMENSPHQSLIQRNESKTSSYYDQNNKRKPYSSNKPHYNEKFNNPRQENQPPQKPSNDEDRPKIFLNFNPDLMSKVWEREKQDLKNNEGRNFTKPIQPPVMYDRLKNKENLNSSTNLQNRSQPEEKQPVIKQEKIDYPSSSENLNNNPSSLKNLKSNLKVSTVDTEKLHSSDGNTYSASDNISSTFSVISNLKARFQSQNSTSDVPFRANSPHVKFSDGNMKSAPYKGSPYSSNSDTGSNSRYSAKSFSTNEKRANVGSRVNVDKEIHPHLKDLKISSKESESSTLKIDCASTKDFDHSAVDMDSAPNSPYGSCGSPLSVDGSVASFSQFTASTFSKPIHVENSSQDSILASRPIVDNKAELTNVSENLSDLKAESKGLGAADENLDFFKKIDSLDKKGKVTLYIKYKNLYNDAKKKFMNEPGDMHKSAAKLKRYKELNMRRKLYYDLKFYLYEQKKQLYASKRLEYEALKEIKKLKDQSNVSYAEDVDEPYSPSSSPLLVTFNKHSPRKKQKEQISKTTESAKENKLPQSLREDGDEPYSPSSSPVISSDSKLLSISDRISAINKEASVQKQLKTREISGSLPTTKSLTKKDNSVNKGAIVNNEIEGNFDRHQRFQDDISSPPGSPIIPVDVNSSFITSTSALTQVLKSFVSEICDNTDIHSEIVGKEKVNLDSDSVNLQTENASASLSKSCDKGDLVIWPPMPVSPPLPVEPPLPSTPPPPPPPPPLLPHFNSSTNEPSMQDATSVQLSDANRTSCQGTYQVPVNLGHSSVLHPLVQGTGFSLTNAPSNPRVSAIYPGQTNVFGPLTGVRPSLQTPLVHSVLPSSTKGLPVLGVVKNETAQITTSNESDMKDVSISLATALLLPPPPPPTASNNKFEELPSSPNKEKTFSSIITEFFENWKDPMEKDESPESLFSSDSKKRDFEVVYSNVSVKTTKDLNIMGENLYERKSLAQPLIDKVENVPLVGLQYVLEVQRENDANIDSASYICSLCSKKMSSATLVAHVKSVPHRLKFTECFCDELHEKFGKMEVKQWTGTLVKEFTSALQVFEKNHGRQTIAVTYEKHMNTAVNYLKNKVAGILRTDEQKGSEEVRKDDPSRERKIKSSADLYRDSFRQHSKENSPRSVKRSFELSDRPGPKSSKLPRSELRSKERETERDRERQRERDRNKDRDKDRDSSRFKLPIRESPPRRTSTSPRRRDSSHKKSRTRSPQGRSDRSPLGPKRDDRNTSLKERKLSDFRADDSKFRNDTRQLLDQYIRHPESHPRYKIEWERFWDRRCREVKQQGSDLKFFDFKVEWIDFWPYRLRELCVLEYKDRRSELLNRYRIEDPDPNMHAGDFLPEFPKPVVKGLDNFNKPFTQDAEKCRTRSRSPGDRRYRNINESSNIYHNKTNKNNDLSRDIYEAEFSVVGTLKLLTTLEDQLGSLYPGTQALLKRAISIADSGGKAINLFENSENIGLLRLASVKLSSLISSGILGVMTSANTQRAIECINWILKEAEKFSPGVKSRRIANLGLDLNLMSTATIGMNTMQIAQYIAQQLFNIGKSDVDETVLQEILMAISENHTQYKLKAQPEAKFLVNQNNENQLINDPQYSTRTNEPSGFHSVPALFPSGSTQAIEVKGDPKNDVYDEKPIKGSALSLLQSAYDQDDDSSKEKSDMDKLSLEELQNLLSNFKSLNSQEQQNLTGYLKKLEATDNKKVTKLRSMMQNTKPIIQKVKQDNYSSSGKAQNNPYMEKNLAHTTHESHVEQQYPQHTPNQNSGFPTNNSSNDTYLNYPENASFAGTEEQYPREYDANVYSNAQLDFSDNIKEQHFPQNRQPLLTRPAERMPMPLLSTPKEDISSANMRQPLLSTPKEQYPDQPSYNYPDVNSQFSGTRQPLIPDHPGANSRYSNTREPTHSTSRQPLLSNPRQPLLTNPNQSLSNPADERRFSNLQFREDEFIKNPEEDSEFEEKNLNSRNSSVPFSDDRDTMHDRSSDCTANKQPLLQAPDDKFGFHSKEYRIGSAGNNSRQYDGGDREQFPSTSGPSSNYLTGKNRPFKPRYPTDRFNENDYSSRNFSADDPNQDGRKESLLQDNRPTMFSNQLNSFSHKPSLTLDQKQNEPMNEDLHSGFETESFRNFSSDFSNKPQNFYDPLDSNVPPSHDYGHNPTTERKFDRRSFPREAPGNFSRGRGYRGMNFGPR